MAGCSTFWTCAKSGQIMAPLVISLCPPHYSGPDSEGSGPRPAQRTGAAPESGVLPPEPHSPPVDLMSPGLVWAAPQLLLGPVSASARQIKQHHTSA